MLILYIQVKINRIGEINSTCPVTRIKHRVGPDDFWMKIQEEQMYGNLGAHYLGRSAQLAVFQQEQLN